MKKAILSLFMTVCLSGCGLHYGQINCETIEVKKTGGNWSNWFSHKEGFDQVYEFISARGTIYTDYLLYSSIIQQGPWTQEPSPIRVYKTKGSQGYTEYTYNRRVGPIGTIHNYYLDQANKRTIETELIYNTTALSYTMFCEMEGAEEAYECVQKNKYYHLLDGTGEIYLDSTPEGLNCRFSQTFDETYEIKYTALEESR